MMSNDRASKVGHLRYVYNTIIETSFLIFLTLIWSILFGPIELVYPTLVENKNDEYRNVEAISLQKIKKTQN